MFFLKSALSEQNSVTKEAIASLKSVECIDSHVYKQFQVYLRICETRKKP